MSKRGFDVLLVRKSGPVRSLSMSSGWLYLVVLVLLVMVAGVGGNSYLLYRQQLHLAEVADDTRLLMLRAERLESLVQEQETRDILSQQAAEERAAALPGKAKGKAAQPPPPKEDPDKESEAGEAAAQADEPQSSDRLSIKNVEQRVEGGELVVSFDLINEREPRDPAMGYIALVVKGQRQGRQWFEAWPPMRLNALGRPQNYHRGTPFSVQRYRRVLARVASLDDKKFETLEFIIYSRQGNLVMVKALPVTLAKGSSRSQ
ncbi:MAG: hypothetical protein HY910_04215 [Desulfarculus sp.]|nr:hypothetical protein [Desulfarculus sp.]